MIFQSSGVYGKVFHSRRRRSWCSSCITLTGPLSSSLLFLSNKLISSDVFFFGLRDFFNMLLLSFLLLRFSFFYFSGFGMFQVKYDGQLRTEQDVHSLACDVHCFRVQKSNSGANKLMEWTDGGYIMEVDISWWWKSSIKTNSQ